MKKSLNPETTDLPESQTASESRAVILQRIGGGKDNPGGKSRSELYAELPRKYRRAGTLDSAARLALFEERLREYDAGVHRSSEAELPQAIARILSERKKSRLALPAGFPAPWLPTGILFVTADDLEAAELDTLDGVVTGCSAAIAVTGTLILQTVPGQGPRKLSLVPDYHLCVVRETQVVETPPEGFDRIAPTATLPTTLISGPSATADIEMTRIKGVHGPRFLDVLLVV